MISSSEISISIIKCPNYYSSSSRCNTKEENDKIKKGEGDDLWKDKPHKKSHKDIDARWTNLPAGKAGKNNENFYGYKNHAKVDCKSKFVNKYVVTDASVHDSQALDELLDEKDKVNISDYTDPPISDYTDPGISE